MQEQRNVKWILIISIVMLLPSIVMGFALYPYYYYPTRTSPDPLTTLTLYINRISTLLFIATITTGTLATAGFPRKDMMTTASIYLFTAAMALLFITMLKLLFTFPSTP